MARSVTSTLLILVVLALSSPAFAFTVVSPGGSRSNFKTCLSESAEASETEEPPVPVRCPDCDKCDGSGRILGGIPTVLPWWPIKPYRPCPNFIANGGQYSRIGQPLDEIAFGRGNIDDEDDDF